MYVFKKPKEVQLLFLPSLVKGTILLMSTGLQIAANLKRKSFTGAMKERALLLHSQIIFTAKQIATEVLYLDYVYGKRLTPWKYEVVVCLAWLTSELTTQSIATTTFLQFILENNIFSEKHSLKWNRLSYLLSHILLNRRFICFRTKITIKIFFNGN